MTEVMEVNNLMFETHYSPVLDEAGKVAGVNGVAVNITERAGRRRRRFAG